MNNAHHSPLNNGAQWELRVCTDDPVILPRHLPKRTHPQVPPRNDWPTDAFLKESGRHPRGGVVGRDYDIHYEPRGAHIETHRPHPFRSSTRQKHHVIHRGRYPIGECSVIYALRAHIGLSALCTTYSGLWEYTDGDQFNPGSLPKCGQWCPP